MSGVVRHEATVTSSEAVRALFQDVGVPFSFEPVGEAFSYRQRHDGDDSLTVVQLDLDGAYSAWGETEVFCAADVRAARYDWRTRDETGSGTRGPALFRPGDPVLVVGAAVRVTNINLAPRLLQEVAETVYGTDGLPVRFASVEPVSPRLGEYWTRLSRVAREAVNSGAFDADLVRADLTRHLAVAALECFPLAGDPRERTLSMEAQARRYRIAARFLDDHASLPISVEDAARAAGTTTPALVRAFRANHPLGLHPLQYLRRARLAAAHADLVAGDPSAGDTVRKIALRWGFAHQGRFAAAYRRIYGVNPREVLDR